MRRSNTSTCRFLPVFGSDSDSSNKSVKPSNVFGIDLDFVPSLLSSLVRTLSAFECQSICGADDSPLCRAIDRFECARYSQQHAFVHGVPTAPGVAGNIASPVTMCGKPQNSSRQVMLSARLWKNPFLTSLMVHFTWSCDTKTVPEGRLWPGY